MNKTTNLEISLKKGETNKLEDQSKLTRSNRTYFEKVNLWSSEEAS